MKLVPKKTDKTMATRCTKYLQTFRTTVCALALTGVILSPSAVSAAPGNPATQKATTQIAQATQDQTTEKRKQIASQAVAAVNETGAALKALDDGKTADALAALERATGKLDLILARDPSLALAPTTVAAVTYDVYASVDDVKAASKKAESLLDDGKVQEARHILKNLASETVISVSSIPLATYPAAIKEAVRLIDDGKTDQAKTLLQTALNTLVIADTVIPLPVVTAQQILKEAETLAEKKGRTDGDNKRLTDLLGTARARIDMAQALGYGTRQDFDSFYKELSSIEEKTANGKSGSGFFETIKSLMSTMLHNSQSVSGAKTSSVNKS